MSELYATCIEYFNIHHLQDNGHLTLITDILQRLWDSQTKYCIGRRNILLFIHILLYNFSKIYYRVYRDYKLCNISPSPDLEYLFLYLYNAPIRFLLNLYNMVQYDTNGDLMWKMTLLLNSFKWENPEVDIRAKEFLDSIMGG